MYNHGPFDTLATPGRRRRFPRIPSALLKGNSGSCFDHIRDKDLTGGFDAFGESLGGLLGGLWEAFGRLVAAFWKRPEVSGRALACSVWEVSSFGLGLVWIRQEVLGRVSGKLLGGARRAWEGRVYGRGASKLLLERMYARQR